MSNSMQSTASTQSQVLETVQKKTSPSPHHLTSESMKNPVLWISGSFLVAFVAMAISDGNLLSTWVNNGFSFSAGYFGAFWQILLLANFIIGLSLAIGKTGLVRLGKMSQPEIDTFKIDNFFGGSFSIKNNVNENILIYSLLSKGYKAGGINQNPYLIENSRFYNPEYNINIEFGIRFSWNKLTTNVIKGGALIGDEFLSSIKSSPDRVSDEFFVLNYHGEFKSDEPFKIPNNIILI